MIDRIKDMERRYLYYESNNLGLMAHLGEDNVSPKSLCRMR